jgi:polysaccharide export outer membrane protein
MKAVLFLLNVGLPAILAVSCAATRVKVTQVPVLPEVVQASIRFRKEYVLAPGDQIEVAVRRAPEASRTVFIRPDGLISLPLLQDVPASGLTARELSIRLQGLLGTRLIDPEVNVIPTQVRQPVVYVLGDVNNNVAAPFRDAPTAIQAIALAGGFRRSAAASDVTIIRLSEDGTLRAIPVAAPGRLDARPGFAVSGQPAPIIALRSAALQADDIVFVPENGRSQLARFLDDFVNRPLGAFNGVVGTYVNFRLVEILQSR